MKKFVSAVLTLFVSVTVLFAQDLKTYKDIYDKQMSEIAVEHGMSVTKLNESYKQALNNLNERVTQAGDLDGIKAVMAEIERFNIDKIVTAETSKDSTPDLKNIQLSYMQNMETLENVKTKKVITLSSKYDSALERLQKTLAQQRKLDEATAVQEERELVAKSESVVSAKAVLTEKSSVATKNETKPSAFEGINSVAKSNADSISLEEAMKMFALDDATWSIEDDYLTGKAGYTERFRSKPFQGKDFSFGFKIRAKWYHGILVNIDGTEAWYSRGHLLNEKAGISVDDEWEWMKGRVDKPDEFVPMSLEVKGNKVTWYYDGTKVTTTTVVKGSIKNEREIKVGFSCHSSDLQIKDFCLKKK